MLAALLDIAEIDERIAALRENFSSLSSKLPHTLAPRTKIEPHDASSNRRQKSST